MNSIVVKIFYVLFLSCIVALFVGFGISTFHPDPEMPEDPSSSLLGGSDALAYDLAQQQYERDMDVYEDAAEAHDVQVAVIALAAAVAIFALSLSKLVPRKEIAYGLLLGSLFTLCYAMGRGFESGDNQVSFITVTVALAVVLYLGHRTFTGNLPGARRKQTADAASAGGPGGEPSVG